MAGLVRGAGVEARGEFEPGDNCFDDKLEFFKVIPPKYLPTKYTTKRGKNVPFDLKIVL